MDRREFLMKAGTVAAWAGIPITIGACSDDDDPAQPNPDGDDDVAGVVGGDHSHSGAVVTAAQINAAQEVTLTLSGVGHTHDLVLSAAQVTAIGAGTQVMATSSSDNAHSHPVTFN